MNFFLILCFSYFFVMQVYGHKIVYLISPPRCLSTVFLRMMQAHGDFEVIQEPSFSEYAKLNDEQFKSCIVNKAENKNVFIKETTVLLSRIKNFLLHDTTLVKSNSVYFIFLIRNPHHAIISRYNTKNISMELNAFSLNTGFKNFYEIFTYIKKEAYNQPCVIFAEDLYMDTENTCRQLCNFLTIPYKKTMLGWEALGNNFTGELWGNVKPASVMQKWHNAVINSTNIHEPSQYNIDQYGNPTFEEVEEKDKKICSNAYTENLFFYNQMLGEKKYFLKVFTKSK